MTPEERSLLERTYRMSEENNSILRKMRRTSRFATVVQVIYWIIIVGIALGAYYYLQPYLMQMEGIIGQAESVLGQVKK